MAREERNGKRKTREQFARRRVPELGLYFIVTDTKETEKNYMYGLRDSIPEKLQGKLVIKVVKVKSDDLVDRARELASIDPQYGEIWIIFDHDKVVDFDKIISRAEAAGINVGWSNPCIEEWFNAYFGMMPVYKDSVECCKEFARCFKKAVGSDYVKSDRSIYDKLVRFGNEGQAIKVAQQKYDEHKNNGRDKPSEMCPCTTVHLLVKEIKSKI